ncbi:hypothetical protein PF011_g8247 [Phytophthora fragariae]|uniref:Uncharacterized protein n=1 Tax=Phytophthora fragariae TaxID=53985 RepID=A0A6A3L7U2_9STRA|nr:hypothetical protein PF011_g8247 [Phytophthora fragariae]
MPRKAKKTKFEKEAENLAALLNSGNDEDAVLAGQAAFWKDFRARVAENDASIGLDALDLLAMAILQDDESATLSGTVLLLPPPDAMQAGVAPFHALINPDAASPPVSSKRPAPRSAVKPKAPPAKKQRKAPKKVIYSFNLPGSTPAQVKLDLAAIVQVATSRGLAPFRIAYAWGENDSDFEADGKYTALAPTPPLQMPKASDEDSDEGELSHTGLTEDSEASDDENGGVTPVESTKAGKKRAGASKPKEGSSHSGRSSGEKPSGSKTSSGKSGGGEAGGGGKAESGEGGGGKKIAPSTSPSGSSTTEEMPPAATVELKSSDTGGAQVSAAAEP